MSDKLVQVTAQTIVAVEPTPTPQSGTLISQNLVTADANLPSVTTSVETITIVSTVSNMGEEARPNPGLFKRAGEVSSAVETFKLLVRKAQLETATATETFSRRVTFNRAPTETATASDLEYVTFTKRHTTDTSTVSETVTSLVVFNRALSETATASETRLVDFNKVLNADTGTTQELLRFSVGLSELDTATAADTHTTLNTFNRTFSETVIGTDDFDGVGVIDDDQIALVLKSLQNNADLLDTETFRLIKPLTETATAQETFSRVVGFNISIGEISTTTDITSTVVLFNRTELDTAIAQELVAFDYELPEQDTTTASETFSSLVNFIRLERDTATTEELVAFNYGLPESDNATASETFSPLVDFNRELAETTTAQESLLLQTNFNRNNIEISTTSELLRFLVRLSQLDTATTTDTATSSTNFNRSFAEIVTSTDDFGGVGTIDDDQIALVLKRFEDNSDLLDTETFALIKTLTETATTSDVLSFLKSTPVGLTETATFTEVKLAHYNNYNISPDYMELTYVGTELIL